MKYVKLFENWLNEAEGGGVKPFDPSNPGATMVVDITNKDLSKPYIESLKKIIPSIIAKCTKKSEDVSKSDIEGIEITTFYFDDDESSGNNYTVMKLKKDKLDSNATMKINIRTESVSTAFNEYNSLKGEPILYFSTEKFSSDSINKEGFIKRSSNGFFIFPTTLDVGDPKDFGLNANCSILPWNPKLSVPFQSTLGKLCKYILGGFQDPNELKKDAKPQEIAKALGYEIPDNYTPGQGVEKTKA